MELANLPKIEFANKSTTDIESAVITMYESISGRTLAPGDPVRLLLESITSIIVQQRALIDYTGKQNLLAYATGNNLDHMGVLVGTDRLSDAAAETRLRFTLAAIQKDDVLVPAGTRATPGKNVLFETKAESIIYAGQMSVEIEAVCTESGTVGNGYAPGQINKIVDPIPWVASVTNTVVSEAGADVEGDDPYRLRIQQAPEQFSVAGPDGAYLYHAKRASALIVDVSVYSPTPGVVEIRPLLQGGDIPGTEILDAVKAVVNDKRVRPLTDFVKVFAPEQLRYKVDVTYWIDAANATTATAIQRAVNSVVDGWVLWQKSKLGRDINPSELIARMVAAGAKRVLVSSPLYTPVMNGSVASAESVAVVFGGLEDG